MAGGQEAASPPPEKRKILFKKITKKFTKRDFFFSLPNEYFDSIKGRLSDSYSVISQVWMLC